MADCRFNPTGENVYEFIVPPVKEIEEIVRESQEACVVPVTSQWSIVYSLNPGQKAMNISELGYFIIPKLYGLMDTSSLDASGITATLNQPFLEVAGQGIIVGLVDTGIDYTLDSFRDSAGFTRIGALWDQTIEQEMAGSDESTFSPLYGTAYHGEDIDRALVELEAGGDPYAIVPSKDPSGHGTFVAGVMAASKTGTYGGAAPQAELAVVKLRQAKQYLREFYLVNDEVDVYGESDIMMGVRFLLRYAEEQRKPLVILVGLGTASGPRIGVSPLANLLDIATTRRNTVVVVPMGNEGNARTHYAGRAITNGTFDQMELNVTSKGKGFVMEIWADSLDILTVSVVSPSGEQIPKIPVRLGNSTEFGFLLETSRLTVDYQITGLIAGYEVIVLRFLTPVEGVWRINVYSLTDMEGVYNAWLPLEAFMASQVYFVQSTPNITLTPPAVASRVISVGAYDHITGAIAPFSGRGYTADNRIKPDLIAPGVDVYGPVSGNRFEYYSGTSVAAAHVAGAAALLLCWGIYYGNAPNVGSNEIKLILLRGAVRDSSMTYPNNISGFGRLNLIESFYQMRII